MVADSKLLSICIPTYNGAKYIQNNIDIILKQIKEYNLSGVEIVVSDNCSTDEIPDIMKKYKEMYPDIIRYNRNEANLGYDRNVMKCCEIASGKFIHLFGDDDYYSPNGLKRLYDVLLNNEDLSVLVLSNYYLRNDYYGLIVSRKSLNEKFTIKDKIYNNDSDNFIIDVEDRAWPNTNLVFRKEYFNQIPDLEKFYKKDWIHIYILLYIAKNWPNSYLFADKYPIVINRVGVQSWLNNNDGPRIYFNNLWVYSFANKLGYSKRVFNWYRKTLLSEYIKNVTFRRSNNFFINIEYIVKYFKYWKDLYRFYTKFVREYLKPCQTVFSVKNEKVLSRKRKVLTILGCRFCLKEYEQPKIEFAHKFDESDILLFQNEKGNLRQFVTGDFYSEMNKNLEYFWQYKLVPEDFCKRVARLKNKKLISYSDYLSDCSYYQNILMHIDKKAFPENEISGNKILQKTGK